MPLIKSKSKKAIAHNIKAEMDAGKPQKQSIAIALSVKAKPKKMAKGGGVHAPSDKEGKSEAGLNIDRANKLPSGGEKMGKMYEAKKAHKDNLKDLKSMAPPNIKGLAEGGEVKKPKIESKDAPDMAKSSVFSTKDRKQVDKESGSTLNYNDLRHEFIKLRKSEKFGEKKMAEGGEIEESVEDSSPEHMKVILKENSSEPMHNEDKQPKEHHKSIADAIMAKKKMAEGGRVDIEENNEEQPNGFYEQNEHEAIDWDMDNGSDDPMVDSIDGDDLNSNEHDMISKLRAKMAIKRAFK